LKQINWVEEIVSFAKMLAVSFVIVFLFTHFVAKPVRVEGDSMYPTLKDQDLGFSSVMKLDEIERFDIVVVKLDHQDKYIVKRVIGLPNESIMFKEDQLYINNQPMDQSFLSEEYVNSQKIHGIFTYDFSSVQLNENEYFLMGDNRMNSQDSRSYGPFRKDQIVSKHLFTIFPLNRIGVK